MKRDSAKGRRKLIEQRAVLRLVEEVGANIAGAEEWKPRDEDRPAIDRLMIESGVSPETPQYFSLRSGIIDFLVSVTRVLRRSIEEQQGNDIALARTTARNALLEFLPGVDAWVSVWNGDKTRAAHIKRMMRQFIDVEILGERKPAGYTGERPPSEAAVTAGAASGMRDDFNRTVKTAKAENLARAGVSAAHALATYRALVRNVDLLNPRLSEAEKLTRAERLYKAYGRVRQAKPDFRDTGQQIRAANRIRMAEYRRRKTAREAAQAALG